MMIRALVCFVLSWSCAMAEKELDPLTLATELSQSILGDDDVASAQQLIVVRALLAKERLAEAERLAGRIIDYRRGVAIALCAETHASRREGRADAERLLSAAQATIQKSTPAGANQIRLYLCMVWALLGESERIVTLADAITDKEVRTAARLMHAVVRLQPGQEFDLVHWKNEIEQTAEKAPFPPAVMAAETLGRKAVEVLKTETRSEALTASAEKWLEQADQLARLALVSHAEAMIPLAIDLLVTKQSRIANRLLLQAASEVRQMPATYDLKPFLSAQLARYWQLSGKADGARSLLDQGESMVPDLPSMDQPRALAWLASGWQRLSEVDRSSRLVDRAISVAEVNPNPRMKTLAALEICLAHDSVDQKLDEVLVRRLRDLADLP